MSPGHRTGEGPARTRHPGPRRSCRPMYRPVSGPRRGISAVRTAGEPAPPRDRGSSRVSDTERIEPGGFVAEPSGVPFPAVFRVDGDQRRPRRSRTRRRTSRCAPGAPGYSGPRSLRTWNGTARSVTGHHPPGRSFLRVLPPLIWMAPSVPRVTPACNG